MNINKIDHICIAVKNLDEARKVWEPALGKSGPDDEYIDEPEKIKVARYWLGQVGFELMESTTPDGDVAKFIEKRGEGVMLISLNVDNTREAVEELKTNDYPIIGGIRSFIRGSIEEPCFVFRVASYFKSHRRILTRNPRPATRNPQPMTQG